MKISVVTPTWNRARNLPSLVSVFNAQTYPDLELVVADDSDQPSQFMLTLNDPRIRYHYLDKRYSLGAKRNFLIDKAQGPLIAFFDDDDYYAPAYLQTMAQHLLDADLVTLSSWFALNQRNDSMYYWDTSRAGMVKYYYVLNGGPVTPIGGLPETEKFFADNMDGYAFSYMFRKSVFPNTLFPPVNDGSDDSIFIARLRDNGHTIRHFPDETGLVVHLIHGKNVSPAYPQFRLPKFVGDVLFPGLKSYLKMLPDSGTWAG